MYDELIRQMKACCNGEPCEEANCGFNPKSDLDCIEQLLTKAADAIEELSEQLENETEYATALNSYVPQWIPVTERLPKLHEEVIVCNEEYGRSELGFAMVAVWDGTDWIETWEKIEAIHCVTHWMPLPEPPEKESES